MTSPKAILTRMMSDRDFSASATDDGGPSRSQGGFVTSGDDQVR
jgi:hypothetical protein